MEQIRLDDYRDNQDDTKELEHWLNFLKKDVFKPDDKIGKKVNEDQIRIAERSIELINALLHQGSDGLVLFHLTAKELEHTLPLLEKLLKTSVKVAVLMSDPPHEWTRVATQYPSVPFLEFEDRNGIEIIADVKREQAKETILDLLATRLPLGPIPDDLVRALRKTFIPSSDIGIERAVIGILNTSSTGVYRELVDSQTEREARWKKLPPEQRARAARIVEAYSLEEGVDDSHRNPEIHAEIVLRLAVLDPSCLPLEKVTEAKKFLSTFLQNLITELGAEGPEPPTVRRYLCALADRVILNDEVVEVFRPTIAFRAHTAVKDFLSLEQVRSKVTLRVVKERLQRAKEAGCDVSEDEKCLSSVDFSLLPNEIPSPKHPSTSGTRLERITKQILKAFVDGDRAAVKSLLSEREKLLQSDQVKPMITRSDATEAMSIAMTMAMDNPYVFDLDKEIASLDEELKRRLEVLGGSPTPAQIKAIKELMLNAWCKGWAEKLMPKEE